MENVNIPVRRILKNLWKREKSPEIQKASLWSDLSIPAKTFYKISETGDLNLLIISGDPNEKELNAAWLLIIDEVYKFRNDSRAKSILAKQANIAVLNYKIEAIRSILGVLNWIILSEDQQKEVINSLKKLGISIKNNSKKEILRVLKRDFEGFKTKLKIEIDRLNDIQKPESKKMVYESVCLRLSRVIGLSLDINMTLAEFLAAEEMAIDIYKNNKNG